jgi:hypothetical protein
MVSPLPIRPRRSHTHRDPDVRGGIDQPVESEDVLLCFKPAHLPGRQAMSGTAPVAQKFNFPARQSPPQKYAWPRRTGGVQSQSDHGPSPFSLTYRIRPRFFGTRLPVKSIFSQSNT